jgi:hypothetical protein
LGPRASPDGCGKSPLPPGFDPRTIHPVASRYTDYALPAHDVGCGTENTLKNTLERLFCSLCARRHVFTFVSFVKAATATKKMEKVAFLKPL